MPSVHAVLFDFGAPLTHDSRRAGRGLLEQLAQQPYRWTVLLDEDAAHAETPGVVTLT